MNIEILSSINNNFFSWNAPWTACNSWRQKFLEKKILSLVVPTVATIGHCLDKHCTVVNLPSWVLIVLFWKMIIVIFYPCKHLGLMYSVKLPKSFAQKSMVVSLPSPIQKKACSPHRPLWSSSLWLWCLFPWPRRLFFFCFFFFNISCHTPIHEEGVIGNSQCI